jgi:hypothetical protein
MSYLLVLFAEIHFLPSEIRVTTIAEIKSPLAFNKVAIGSTKVPIIIAAGKACSIGKP